MKTNLALVALFSAVCPFVVFAEETPQQKVPELFITASRTPTPLEKIGRSVATIDREEIEQREVLALPQALQVVSAVRSPQLGGPGSPGTAPFEIRGVRSGGTQILLNGMTLSDPSSVSGTYEQFFSFLTLSDIANVEVLKGGTGVLYGSDGQGGAINLISKTPTKGLHGEVNIEGGSFHSTRESALVNAGNDRGGVVSSFTRVDSEGIDAHGDYENNTFSLLGEYRAIPDVLTLSPIYRFLQGKNDLDTGPALGTDGEVIVAQDTERNNVDAKSNFLGLRSEYRESSWAQATLDVYYNHVDRDFFFDFSGFESRSMFDSSSLNADLQNSFDLTALSSQIIAGIEYEHQYSRSFDGSLEDEAQRDQYALYLHDQTEFIEDRWTVSGGLRITSLSDIDRNIPTLEISSSLNVPETGSRLHTSVAEGFRAPTLFESRGKIIDFSTGEVITVGNDNLSEEESLSTDFGITQTLFPNYLEADLTYFQVESDETILYDFANNTHVNGGSGKTRGLEASLLFTPVAWQSTRLAYTNLDKVQGLDGTRRVRTPRNWFSLNNSFRYERLFLAADLRFRDSQYISFFGTAEQAKEDAVSTLDLMLSYALPSNVTLYVRGENVFDVDYTEAGYRMPRAGVYAGIRYGFGMATRES